MWSDEKLRQTSGEVLVELLKGGSKDLVAVVMDVFRVTDDLVPDTSTVELLQALVDPSTDMSAAPSHFVVERLQGLLPYEAELISAIAEKLVAAWRGKLGDVRTDRKSVVTGKSVSVRVDLGGRWIIEKKKTSKIDMHE